MQQQQQLRRRPPGADSPVPTNNTMNRPLRQTSRSLSATANPCSGCSQPMYNPLLSNVLDRFWHPDCVRCVVCRCLLNDQCYSREGKLYCKEDFIKKYIHRCFSCQNLIQSHEFIRRIRAGRIYHADCLVCFKCKRTLQNDDISALMKTSSSFFNDLDYSCQSCTNSSTTKPVLRSMSSSNIDEGDETTDSEISNSTNGKKPLTVSPSIGTKSKAADLPTMTEISVQNNPSHPSKTLTNEFPATEVDDEKNSNNKEQVSSPSTVETNDIVTPTKSNTRQSKARQNNNSNSNNKRSTAKAKGNTRQKQQPITTNERKGRPPSTRSKSSTNASSSSSNVQTRSRNRRPAKTARYRKRNFSSGSDEEDESEDEEDDEEDADYEEEEEVALEERESSRSPSIKSKSAAQNNEKSKETVEPVSTVATTATTPTISGSTQLSEPSHTLMGSLTPNPITVPSLIKGDVQTNFMPASFNPAFLPSQSYPPPNHPFPTGYSLQPRMPIPPPPGVTQPSTISLTENNSAESSVLQHDSTKPADPEALPNAPKQPSALASLVELSALPVPPTVPPHPPIPPSNNPYPFPFVTPGPGVPFSPQAAAGMTTFYRTPFPLDVPAAPTKPAKPSKPSKRKSKSKVTDDSNEIVSQNLLDEPAPPKKKARKSNTRGKGKGKKDVTEDENGPEEDLSSPSPPKKQKKKVSKKEIKDDSSTTTDAEEGKTSTTSLNNNPSQNLLTQMGLINNNPMMPPPIAPSTSSSSVSTPTTPLPNAQQAQIAAMYNMAPHFGPYNTFPGPFNPSFPGFPPGYGFHPAFGAPPNSQPFPFLPPTPSMSNPSTSPPTNDKSSSTPTSETRPTKARGKTKNNEEKKKPAAPRSGKKKGTAATTPSNMDETSTTTTTSIIPTNESTTNDEKTADHQPASPPPPSTTTTTKRRISGTESEDIDEPNTEPSTRVTNGKSDQESDGSTNANATTNATPEKKGGRTTIKPQQLEILCKAFESCSKPNKTQREQIANETGLNIRVIQVWFQNKRSKERKGKISKEKETNVDDDDAAEDSPAASPIPAEPAASAPPETISTVESELDSAPVKSDDS